MVVHAVIDTYGRFGDSLNKFITDVAYTSAYKAYSQEQLLTLRLELNERVYPEMF